MLIFWEGGRRKTGEPGEKPSNSAHFKNVRRPKSSHARIFLKLATLKGNDLLGVIDFALERACPEKYPKSEKSGFGS